MTMTVPDSPTPAIRRGPRQSPRYPRLPAPLPNTVLAAFDIIAFGDRRRDTHDHLRLRTMMYGHLIEAFAIAGLPWRDCYREDRGDGALVVAPRDMAPDGFLDPLAQPLATLLRRAGEEVPLRMRMAVHRGNIRFDRYGVTGRAVVHLFRLLEAQAFKRRVQAAGTELGVIISDRCFIETALPSRRSRPAAYRPLRVACKETRARAWTWFPPESS